MVEWRMLRCRNGWLAYRDLGTDKLPLLPEDRLVAASAKELGALIDAAEVPAAVKN